MVQVGNNLPVEVVAVADNGRQITLKYPISWQANDLVSYAYTDDAPDMGAFEFVPTLTVFGSPNDGAVNLWWKTNDTVTIDTTWQIDYIGPAGDQPSPITLLPSETRVYQLTGLTNYTFYNITIGAIQNDQPILTQTIWVMPTDKFVFLPLIQN